VLWIALGFSGAVAAILLGLYSWSYGFESAQSIFQKMYAKLAQAQTIEARLEGQATALPFPAGGDSLSFALQRPRQFWAQMSTGEGALVWMCDGESLYMSTPPTPAYVKAPFAPEMVAAFTQDLPTPQKLASRTTKVSKRSGKWVRGERCYVLEFIGRNAPVTVIYVSRARYLPLALDSGTGKEKTRVEVAELKLDQPLGSSVRFSPPPGATVLDMGAMSGKIMQGLTAPGEMPQMPQMPGTLPFGPVPPGQ